MSLTQLPANVKDLLRGYIGQLGLQELPAPFIQQNTAALYTTKQGHSVIYKHRDTGEILRVNSYPWKSAAKKQQVVVATGSSLPEPVIIVPKHKGGKELKIWKGESSHGDDDGDTCPIYKVYDRGRPADPGTYQVSVMATERPPG